MSYSIGDVQILIYVLQNLQVTPLVDLVGGILFLRLFGNGKVIIVSCMMVVTCQLLTLVIHLPV